MSMGIEEEDDFPPHSYQEERRRLFAACKEYRRIIDRLEKELAAAREVIKDNQIGGDQ